MGNPGGHFTDFEEQTQIITWKWMVEKLAKHYIQRYGLNEVSQWNFETWNEPDHHDFDGLTFTVQGYLNYFDATFQGLKDVSKHVKIGGPGGSCREPHFITLCHALLVHSQNGTNIVSGKKGGSKLDFISFHQKGDQNSRNVVQSTVKKISEIQLLVPELTKDLPIF
jgi:Glycosyl hydrolases family 39.